MKIMYKTSLLLTLMGFMCVEMVHAMEDELKEVNLNEDDNSPRKLSVIKKEGEGNKVPEKTDEKKGPCHIL